MDSRQLIVGSVTVKGNKNATYYGSSAVYLALPANSGTDRLPEGIAVQLEGTGDNMIPSIDGKSFYGVTGAITNACYFNNIPNQVRDYAQPVTTDALDIVVRFADGEPVGSIGDPVYIKEDGTGQFTLTFATYPAVGMLRSGVDTDKVDSLGVQVTGANIQLLGSRVAETPAP